MQLYEYTLREDYYREDPGAESPRPVFGQVVGTDRDEGSNAINFYHALGDSEFDANICMHTCMGLVT